MGITQDIRAATRLLLAQANRPSRPPPYTPECPPLVSHPDAEDCRQTRGSKGGSCYYADALSW